MNWYSRFQKARGRGWWTVYREYLLSEEWSERRNVVLLRDGSCTICGTSHGLEVHHRTYERVGKELLTDLTTLCQPCHKTVTSMLRRRRRAEMNPLMGMARNLLERIL